MNHFAIIVLVIVGCVALTALIAVMASRAGFNKDGNQLDRYTPTYNQTQYMRQVQKTNMRDLEAAGTGRLLPESPITSSYIPSPSKPSNTYWPPSRSVSEQDMHYEDHYYANQHGGARVSVAEI